jgi:hypothetical protein
LLFSAKKDCGTSTGAHGFYARLAIDDSGLAITEDNNSWRFHRRNCAQHFAVRPVRIDEGPKA